MGGRVRALRRLARSSGVARVGVAVRAGPLDLAHWYASWDDAFDPEPLHAVLAGGRVPLISWQPMHQDLHDITAGHHDDYLRTWAQGIQNAPGTVYLRPFPEMNGNWVPWNGDPQALRDAWTHLTTLFANEGTHNVRWVWSPNVTDEPRTEHNRMENYYPGHDHVHVLALSGYNWGDTRPYIGWRSFEEIIDGAYARLMRLGPQPVWMAETASSEVGGDKAAWIRAMFASAGDFPGSRPSSGSTRTRRRTGASRARNARCGRSRTHSARSRTRCPDAAARHRQRAASVHAGSATISLGSPYSPEITRS